MLELHNTNRTGNYAAFYVDSAAYIQDYESLRKYNDSRFYVELNDWHDKGLLGFVDSHHKTYQVRDGSTKEALFKRLHERLRASKNVILFISSHTKESEALIEEVRYAVECLGLPIVVVFPELGLADFSTGIAYSTAKQLAISYVKRLRTIQYYLKKTEVLFVPMSLLYVSAALDFMTYSKLQDSEPFEAQLIINSRTNTFVFERVNWLN